MILIPDFLSFAKLVIMLSTPVKSLGDARYMLQDPFIHGNQCCPIQSRLPSVYGVHSFHIERSNS